MTDIYNPTLVGVRAVKSGGQGRRTGHRRRATRPGAGAALPPGRGRRTGSASHQRRPRRVRAADGLAGVRLRRAAAGRAGRARPEPNAATQGSRPDLRRRLRGHADQRRPGSVETRPAPRRALSQPKVSTARTCSGGIGWRRCCSATASVRRSCRSTCPMGRAEWRRQHAASGCSRTGWCITQSWRCRPRRVKQYWRRSPRWAPDVTTGRDCRRMSGAELRDLARLGVAHRRPYRPPPAIAAVRSRDAGRRDGRQSRAALERIIGVPVTAPGVSVRRLR